jgi:hypothetical protein
MPLRCKVDYSIGDDGILSAISCFTLVLDYHHELKQFLCLMEYSFVSYDVTVATTEGIALLVICRPAPSTWRYNNNRVNRELTETRPGLWKNASSRPGPSAPLDALCMIDYQEGGKDPLLKVESNRSLCGKRKATLNDDDQAARLHRCLNQSVS